MIARTLLDEAINEEMRIFYVALTRAKEKLIITGIQKDYQKASELAQTCDIVFADSFGHEPFIAQAAQEFKDVEFLITGKAIEA